MKIEQAFGLPNTLFVNALVNVSPGHDVQGKQATEEGYGGEEKALTRQRDFNSYQKSPKWIDPPTVSILLHPQIIIPWKPSKKDLFISAFCG